MLFDNIVDFLNAIGLLYEACPGGKKANWTCKRCGLWLGALNSEKGLTAAGRFAYHVEYVDDPYVGRVPCTCEVELVSRSISERHEIQCMRCGVVNRRRRRG
jgi:hypothetical protein